MQENQSVVEVALSKRMDELLQRFGSWHLFLALIGASWRRRQVRNLANNLSPQMRRDIGLPEEEAPGYPPLPWLWHIRP